MRRSLWILLLLSVAVISGRARGEFRIETDAFTARIERGTFVGLADRFGSGNTLAQFAGAVQGAGIHREERDHWAGASKLSGETEPRGPVTETCNGFDGLEDATVTATYAVEPGSGDLVITQQAESPKKGMWGVEWAVAGIPSNMNILVPGNSGLKLTPSTPGSGQTFDYPMTWEAQLVIVEGEGHGFYVWAEDAKGVFKRLTVERNEKGWRLGFITMPFAPFADRSSCTSVKWHMNVYTGDWRVPARRYRDWADKYFNPAPIVAQQPAWVHDTRCCVIMGIDAALLEALPSRLDPKQTMLYLPDWRQAGYDRDYPTYDKPYDTLDPFIRRAHELGFRVMLHVNYFGCDPLNPLYAQFEPYQIRNPWGGHDKEWWLWERADPIIKFAYINPAHKPWRDVLIARLAELCTTHGVDALHLDQTLCIYNDHNGLMDGLSMIDGSVALHRELRAALPQVALSGEGLNEVTYRYEAFAQRHVFAINHADGTYNRGQLGMAHPISSYLLRPYTTMYGYLGIAPPTDGPLYAAWNEAYMHYGVIPTLKPGIADLKAPSGFSAQFFDEVKLWQDRRVDVDMDGAWPPEIAFPFRTADGERVVRTADRRLLCGDREVSRTITGVESVRAKGSIPGWYAYDQDAIFGLDPDRWYAWSAAPRDPNAFHVAAPLPEGFTVGAVARRDTFALVRTRKTGHIDVRLAERMGDAVCGSQPFQGDAVEVHGELHASDGAMFYSGGDVLFAHPPYRTSGTGIAWARFDLELPNDVGRFMSEVALDAGAVGEGKSDGVTFRVSVKNESAEIHAELLNATSEHKPLEVDLKAFRGTHVRVELSVDPGPKRDSSYDWARWYNPRIERAAATSAEMTLADAGPWALAIASQGAVPLAGAPNPFKVAARFPGAVFLLKQAPEVAALPLDLAAAPFETTFVSDDGIVLEAPPHACAARAESEVGGVKRMGLFAHPPDHGRTCVDLPMTLPGTAAVFHGFAGIRDRAKSTGVEFIVEVNGDMQIREKILPGTWKELQCDLALWAGKPIVLSLITDAAGDYICDWAEWGEPRIVAR